VPIGSERMTSLFESSRVAIVGASDGSSWAANLIASLERAGGTELIVPVHPKLTSVFGHKAIASLKDLDEPIDLAFILLGPDKVGPVLEDAAAMGIKNAIILAGGYGESGEDGVLRQLELTNLATKLGITALGPNTIGFINATRGFAPWAVAMENPPIAGPVGAIFESGSMARASYQFAQAHGIGTTIWASVGNAAVVNTMDVLEHLLDDDSTRAIALFMETIREPERFTNLARRAIEAGKPMVAFKAGRSEEGQRSAMAHTGAVATNDAVVDAAFRQFGIARAESIEELVATVGLFGYSPRLPKGRRMGVVTSSGGGCNVIADVAMQQHLPLPPWQDDTRLALEENMPPFSSLLNPLDTTGFGHSRPRHRPTKAEDDLLEIACLDSGVDFMFSMMTPLPSEESLDKNATRERLVILGEIVAASPVPVFLSSNTCMDLADHPRELLAENNLHLLPGATLGLRSLSHAVEWVERRDKILSGSIGGTSPFRKELSEPTHSGAWAEDEGRLFLESAGVGVVPAVLVTSAPDAVSAAEKFGVPVAMKICSPDVLHKSDVGGVALGILGAEQVVASFDQILASVRDAVPNASIRGVLVSPMRDAGVELLIGVTVDPTFGPVLAVAIGGIWIELFKDSSLRVLPVDKSDVLEMLQELRGAALFAGARGTAAIDLDNLSDVIVNIAAAGLTLGNRLEAFEVNPLRISNGRIEALDVLISTRS
jgi:acyl-CoA synthetase (NDP forming)